MWSQLTYKWVEPFIARAKKGFVFPDQMGLLSEKDSSQSLKKSFDSWLTYFKEKKYARPFKYAYMTTLKNGMITNFCISTI